MKVRDEECLSAWELSEEQRLLLREPQSGELLRALVPHGELLHDELLRAWELSEEQRLLLREPQSGELLRALVHLYYILLLVQLLIFLEQNVILIFLILYILHLLYLHLYFAFVISLFLFK